MPSPPSTETDTLCLSLDLVMAPSLFREMYIIMRQEKYRARRAAAMAAAKELGIPFDNSLFTPIGLSEELIGLYFSNCLAAEMTY